MAETRGKNNRHVKSMNRYAILQSIREAGPLTRAEIAAKTSLTFTAVNNIAEELLQKGLLREEGQEMSSGGRKPVLVNLNADGIYSVGLHISVSTVRTAIIDFRGQPVYRLEEKIASRTDGNQILEQIFRLTEKVMDDSKMGKERFAGIGIGVPGPLNPYRGVILSPPNLTGLAGMEMKKKVEERFALPVYIDKDANVMALGELWYGAGKGLDNLIFINANVGIGSGFIFNRRIYQGFPYGAGEIGHNTIDLDGPRCNCGNYGCLEAVASGMAVIRRVGEEIRRGVPSVLTKAYESDEDSVNIYTVTEAALEGDELASNVLNESARYLGIAVGNMINLLTPESIIIGGHFANRLPDYFEQIKDIALSRSFSFFRREILLKPSLFKEDAGIVGTSALVMQNYLQETLNEFF